MPTKEQLKTFRSAVIESTKRLLEPGPLKQKLKPKQQQIQLVHWKILKILWRAVSLQKIILLATPRRRRSKTRLMTPCAYALMRGDPSGRRSLHHSVRFMSINVGRGSSTHEIALARACELQLDVLLIQEPWWSGRTKSHPFFDRHIPYGGANVRPRAVTYTRKGSKEISTVQHFLPSLTGDYCWIEVNGVTFLNVYKAPHDSTAIKPLLDWNHPPRSIVIGDFNSVHLAWQPCASRYYGQGNEIEKWAY
ncbi:hypothetical protein EPUL_006442, partial [Erysiphe pulchra]